MNSLEHIYKNPADNVYIFQNYVFDVYQQRMETLETAQYPCKVIVMDCGLDACQIFNHCETGSVHTIWISISEKKVSTT